MPWREPIVSVETALIDARRQLFSGKLREAHAAAQQALRIDPKAHDAVLVMAAIAIEHANAPGGAKLCQLLRDAGNDSCWLAVLEARVALLSQDQERARERAIAALEIGTDDPQIANQLGVVLSRGGWHDKAVAPFKTAVIGEPANPDMRYNLAVALQFAGELERAEQEFRTLIQLKPDHAKGWLALVQLTKAPGKDWVGQLEKLFEHESDRDGRLTIGHALARLAEDNSEWDASLQWLDRAKQAKRAEVRHNRKSAEALADAAIAAAREAVIAPTPSSDQRPIFIVGMPRSGTTLVERILSSHPSVKSLGELSDFAILLKRHVRTPGPMVLDEALLAAADKLELGAVGQSYLARVAKLGGDFDHYIDKMPFNAFFAPSILRALPGARVICLRRSPFDVLFANYRQLFATGFSYYSYAYDFGDTAHFVAQFERMADAFEEALPSGRFLPVRYEDVIADQRGATERLLAFCGLEWDDACMNFHENAQPVATASSVQVRSPIYTSSKGKWRRYPEGSKRAISELAKYGIKP